MKNKGKNICINGISFNIGDYFSYINSNGNRIIGIIGGESYDNNIQCRCHLENGSINYPYKYSLTDVLIDTYRLSISENELASIISATDDDITYFEECLRKIKSRNYDWYKN